MSWRDDLAAANARNLARLRRSLPDPFPGAVLAHALARRFTPPTPRLAVDSYWRAHPLRADRLARALARRSGAPPGWRWRLDAELVDKRRLGFRTPPAPYRERAFAAPPGDCCVCGQPVFRLGWHADLWEDGRPNRNAAWHAGCVIAWRLWSAPSEHVRLLRKLQGRRCAETGRRLLKTSEVDHRLALHRVWRERRDEAWPDLLDLWGAPNLRVINRDAHLVKCADEARARAGAIAAAADLTGL